MANTTEDLACDATYSKNIVPDNVGNIISKVEIYENDALVQTVTPANDAEAVSLPISYNVGTNKAWVNKVFEDCQYYEVSLQFRRNDLTRSYTLTKKPFAIDVVGMLGVTNANLQFRLNNGSWKTENVFKSDILNANIGDVVTVNITDANIIDAQVRLKFKVQTLVINPFSPPAITIPINSIDTDMLIGFTEKIISFAVATSQTTVLTYGLRTDLSNTTNYTDYPYTTIPTLLTAIAALPANTNYAIHIHWRYTVAADFGGTITLTTGFATGYKTQKAFHVDSNANQLYRGLTHKANFVSTNGLVIRRWKQFEHTQTFTLLAIHEGRMPLLQTFNNGISPYTYGLNIYPDFIIMFNLPVTPSYSYMEGRGYSHSNLVTNKLQCTIMTFDGSITPRTHLTDPTFPAGAFLDSSFFVDRKKNPTVLSTGSSYGNPYPANEFAKGVIIPTTTIINPAWFNENPNTVINKPDNAFNATPKYAANECDATIGCVRYDPNHTPILVGQKDYDYIASITRFETGSLARLQIINQAITPTQAGQVHNTGTLRSLGLADASFLLDAQVNPAGTAFVDASPNNYQIVDVFANQGNVNDNIRGSATTNTGFTLI